MVRNCEAVRALVQRVSQASVEVAGDRVSEIGPGLLVLVAAGPGDGAEQAAWMAGKVARLRILPDDEGRMNRSVLDAGGEVLAVSQFTLYGDASRGKTGRGSRPRRRPRRPSRWSTASSRSCASSACRSARVSSARTCTSHS
jgi:D-tyrosyl-tRNA(Tyr) deacylase